MQESISNNDLSVKKPSLWVKIGDWYRQNWWNIALFALILLSIMLLFGYWRLSILTPEKQPILFEAIDPVRSQASNGVDK